MLLPLPSGKTQNPPSLLSPPATTPFLFSSSRQSSLKELVILLFVSGSSPPTQAELSLPLTEKELLHGELIHDATSLNSVAIFSLSLNTLTLIPGNTLILGHHRFFFPPHWSFLPHTGFLFSDP